MNGSVDGSLLGLGYYAGIGTTATSNSAGGDASEALIQSYMQQCVEYHEARQIVSQDYESRSTLPPKFVAPSGTVVGRGRSTTQSSDLVTTSTAPDPDLSDTATLTIDDRIAQARAKAQAVLQRFQQQQAELLHQQSTKNALDDVPPDPNRSTPAYSFMPMHAISPEVFREQRRLALARDEDRKRTSLLRTLDYLSAKQARQWQTVSDHAAQAERDYRAKMEVRKRALQQQPPSLQSTSGIGTTQRSKIQKQQTKQQPKSLVQAEQQQRREATSVAVYVTNLRHNVNDAMMRLLFASCGDLTKIHYYRHKKTGHRKGDALVIYRVRPDATDEDRQALLLHVCSQINGVELPDGSVLNVEAARSNSLTAASSVNSDAVLSGYSVESDSNDDAGAAENACPHDADECGRDAADGTNDDELDGFFAGI